jgi:predicted transport protein
MKSAIYMDGNRFAETDFNLEDSFEKIVKENSKTLFGSKTIYFDLKNKINTKTLGGSIPDGFLFDFKNKENIQFYLVEVELEKHDFDRHIFPQIKKFFAFFKNPKSREELIGKLFDFIKSNPKIESEFKEYLGTKEIYKTLKDVIENSQNILLIIDEAKPEFEETSDTITEWAKFVKIEILKQYTAENKVIFTLNPDFQEIGFIESPISEKPVGGYTEAFHMEYAEKSIVKIYEAIRDAMLKFDSSIQINPQKYYISFRKNKNFAYVYMKRKKVWITIMLSYDIARKLIEKHKITEEGEGVQKFYGGKCFSVMVENESNLQEVLKALKEAHKQQNK